MSKQTVNKKYKINADGRIEALCSGPWGDAGTIGGYVDSEDNLAHDGDCWVSGDAQVVDNARVYHDAWVSGSALVAVSARVCHNARVSGTARVYDEARVCGSAAVYGDARVFDCTTVAGYASISGGTLRSGEHTEVYVFGVCDDYSRVLCQIDGVAWIGAGCRWFTLTDAIQHWTNHEQDRAEALALLEGAKALARHKGWTFDD